MKRIIWTIFLCGLFLIGGQGEENVYNREVIRFDSGHFKIVGDLHIPNPDKKQPAIIFVHGDGPARRSPSGRPNRIMRSFLDIGFACFYYDKPGYGESTGTFTRGKLFEERASILVDAVKVLKRHAAINPDQIGLWGISQAGYVMPKAITATKDIAFMIAISCPAMDSVDQSAYLVEKQILCDGYDEAEAKKARQYFRQRAHAKTYREYLEAAQYLDQNPFIRSIGWGGIKPEDRFSPLLPSDEGFFNPITLVEKITIPVLAIFGEKDTQIDPFQGAEAYEKALKKAGNRSYRVKFFPEADHGIIIAKTGCMKEQRERYRSSYAPGYIELMKTWLESLSKDGEYYEPNSKVKINWTKKSPMPGPLYAFDATGIGNKIFAVGGRGVKENYGKYNYVFDLQTNTWEVKKELIYDRSNHAVVALEGKIYVFGGNENPEKTEVYDPSTDEWKELAPIPTPRQHINYSAAGVNGKIYVMGGIEKRGEKEFVITDKNEVYDPATNTWEEKTPIPAARQMPAVIGFEEKIYVISGADSNWDDQTTVYVYDPKTDRWDTRASMPEARYISGVAVIQKKIVVITGIRSSYKKSKIFMYHPAKDAWDFLGELPHYFMLAGVASARDKLLILGGSNLEFILFTCLEGDISF